MKKVALHIVAAALLIPSAVMAQEKRLEQMLARHLYPPQMVMQRQRELELTDEQQVTIRDRTNEFQSGVLELQWELEAESQTLVELVEGEAINVEAALEQMDLVLELESRIKRNHLRLLIEIRNILSQSQRALLQQIMEDLLQRMGDEGASQSH